MPVTVHKGPRGGHYYISPKSGKKVYGSPAKLSAQAKKEGVKLEAPSHSTAPKAEHGFKPIDPHGDEFKDFERSSIENINKHGMGPMVMERYTDMDHHQINGGLRNPPPNARSANMAAQMDNVMSTSSTPHDIKTYRGYDMSHQPIPEVGETMKDHAYMSTSVDRSVTSRFMEGPKDKRVLMEINVPKGSKAQYVEGISANKGEKELLLDRGARLKITSKKFDPENGWIVQATLESTNQSRLAQ